MDNKNMQMPNDFHTKKSAIPGMRCIIISDGITNKTIEFRNVGDKNPDAQIQVIVQEYRIRTNRTTSVSFSIPAAVADYFIEGISKPC